MNDNYQKNVKRWAAFEPNGEALLKNIQPLSLDPRPEQEVREWFQSLELGNRTVLYVYGLGAGETYPVVKEWLQSNPLSHAVFLEPDLRVIKAFLMTEEGKTLLYDPQVMLRHANEKTTYHLATLFVLKPFVFAVWGEQDPMQHEAAKARLDFLTSQRMGMITEYSRHGYVFWNNYFQNLLDLPEAYLAEKLYGKFQGVPAIICGAGPSLGKNIEVLKRLGDRALIFAGATAMNALNAFGFNPHFGVGIDPNPEQFTRLIMNQAFEVPYIYKQRFLNKALETVHGDHLAITATSGYDIGQWVDKQLGLKNSPVEEGHNVVNLSTALAQMMGCNPIILVGLDLAYTDMQSYSPGVVNHPLHNFRDQFRTKSQEDQLVRKSDIYGNPTLTLWKWIAESIWYSKFAAKHPETLFVNATEGGIGFEGIPNIPLAQVVQTFLIHQFDLNGRVEQAIQMAKLPPEVNFQKVIEVLDNLESNLQKSVKLCSVIIKSFDAVEKGVKSGDDAPPGLLTDEGLEALLELEQQPAYEAILKLFNAVFREMFLLQFEKIDRDAAEIGERELNLEKLPLYRNRIKYVREGGKAVLKILEECRQKGVKRRQALQLGSGKIVEGSEIPDDLHNYSVFYGEEGQVISFSKFNAEGVKEGVAKTFYATGKLHSLQQFSQGKLAGKQLYYYENGILKTVLNYSDGVLDGEVLLYYPSGALKRQLMFSKGKRQGVERIWNAQGGLTVEVEFNQDQPCGIARSWYDNGSLAQEVIFKEDGTVPEYSEWGETGEKKIRTTSYKHDYFDQVALQTGALTKAMEQILNQVKAAVPAVEVAEKKAMDPDLRQEIENVKAELKKMHHAGRSLLFESGLDPSNPDEAIWKTPEMRKEIEGQVDQLTTMMQGEIDTIQSSLMKTVELLSKKLEAQKKPREHD